MEVKQNGVEVELDMEFWPLQHPMEPPDEDHPVQCPMPHSTVINIDGSIDEKRIPESWRKRAENSTAQLKEGKEGVIIAETPARPVRKRHHNLIRGDHHMITPLTRMSPLPPLPSQNITIFQMLQHFDKFEP